MNILIMGATGYLGRHLVKMFDGGADRIFTLRHGRTSESNQEMDDLFKTYSIDWLVNCVGVYQKECPANIIEGNLNVPICVMENAVRHKVRNVLNINTSLPDDVDLYSFTKREVGRFGRFLCRDPHVSFYNLLVELFYGPDQPRERFLPSIMLKMMNQEDVFLTEGLQYRDVVHIEDVCRAVGTIMANAPKGYHDIPVGTGERHTIRDTVEFLHNQLASESKLFFGAVPTRVNEPDCVADLSFMNCLGFRNKYSWETGLMDMVKNFKG